MQWRGMRIDRQYTRKILDDIEFDYLKADSELLELFGFSPRSPKVVGWLEERGVRFHERTKTGRGKLDKTTLPILAAQADPLSEVGQALHNKLILSTNQNLLNNLRGILTVADRNDMIHPRINTQAAVTGRSSIVNPAMQTFKKTDKRLRGCFIARDGYLFVGADYDGQETRLAAAYSQDEMLLKILDRGLRQHVETAISIFGKNYTEPEYGDAKILDFAQQYGAGPRKLAAQMGVPYAVALERWKAWRGTYAGLVSWTEFMSTLPIVVNPWGRRIPRDRFRPYANGNYMIQSSGRDMLGDAMIALREQGLGDAIWLTIHDEIILEVPEHEAESVLPVLEVAMYAKVQGIELTASAEIIGRRWNGAEKPAIEEKSKKVS